MVLKHLTEGGVAPGALHCFDVVQHVFSRMIPGNQEGSYPSLQSSSSCQYSLTHRPARTSASLHIGVSGVIVLRSFFIAQTAPTRASLGLVQLCEQLYTALAQNLFVLPIEA